MSVRTDWEMHGLSEAAVRSFEARVRGTVIQPGDDEYDPARRVWNAAVDRHPALIVRPHEVADVIEAVGFARSHDLPLAVRGGGHSPAGYGTADLGLVVDLSAMKRLDVDPDRRVASAEAGLTWGEYNAGTHEHGLATPGGDVAAVGIAGLTLSGGMGWLMRKHGMTIDNLLEVDVVTTDGRLLTASERRRARPVLGAPWRWRQLRDRDRIPVSPPSGRNDSRRRDRLPRHARRAARRTPTRPRRRPTS